MKRRTTDLAIALKDYLGDHLPRLRGMSPQTVRSYRDCFVILLRFLAAHLKKPLVALNLDDLGVPEVLAFLQHLERDRRNKTTTRNVRLAALHAFFRYAATRHPDRLEQSQRILGIPFKRCRQREVEYLEFEEIEAVFATIDRATSRGRRDYVLLAAMFNTGARVQEILDLRGHDLQLERPFQVLLRGKGRKERICPIWPQTAEALKAHCLEHMIDLRTTAPVFLNYRGQPLTRFGVRYILAKYLEAARLGPTPSLRKKRLHPHSMRHSTAVHLLKAGVDLVSISQWLGHASSTTTNKYARLDLELKRQALARARPLRRTSKAPAPWRHDKSILDWLEGL